MFEHHSVKFLYSTVLFSFNSEIFLLEYLIAQLEICFSFYHPLIDTIDTIDGCYYFQSLQYQKPHLNLFFLFAHLNISVYHSFFLSQALKASDHKTQCFNRLQICLEIFNTSVQNTPISQLSRV